MPNQPPPPTILSLKSDFLTTQTRTLSQPLAPTRAFLLSLNDSPQDQDQGHQSIIPPKPLTEALTKLNHVLTQHSRRAYPPVATRHVAEQIDKLYFTSTTLAKGGQGDEGSEEGDEEEDGQAWLRVNADLTSSRLIALMPDTWGVVNGKEAEDYPMEARRFEELVGRLKELDGLKQKVLERVARLRRIRGLVEGFEDSDADFNSKDARQEGEVGGGGGERGGRGIKAVQENLVTKNGEMEAELQRMRVLLARVGGRVEKLDKERAEKEKERERGSSGSGRRKRAREGEDEEGGGDERKKVDKLLESF
ncbi:kinetochore Sim4 complex subunit Fta4 [Copromyces sp. CBS 386.78]|nr:kinetochore Sim4 complex subunit Fta4 [Copromyces sp. CBS 386.78]